MPSPPELQQIPLKQIVCNDADNYCRGEVTRASVAELANQIKTMGLINPITVMSIGGGYYKVVAGFRRFRAHQVIDAESIQAVIREGLTDEQVRLINFTENLERQDLTKVQEAQGVKSLLETGMTVANVARAVKKNRRWVEVRRYILDFEPNIQRAISDFKFTDEQIETIYDLKDFERRCAYVRKLKDYALACIPVPRALGKLGGRKESKKVRTKVEIVQMNAYLFKMFGESIVTRTLGWAAGLTPPEELFEYIKGKCEQHGITFIEPEVPE